MQKTTNSWGAYQPSFDTQGAYRTPGLSDQFLGVDIDPFADTWSTLSRYVAERSKLFASRFMAHLKIRQWNSLPLFRTNLIVNKALPV